jgi:hypothetical protein
MSDTDLASILRSSFAERTIAGIDNSLMVNGGMLSRWLYNSTNGSPILAVYGALVLSLLSYIAIFGIYRILDKYNELPGFCGRAGKNL